MKRHPLLLIAGLLISGAVFFGCANDGGEPTLEKQGEKPSTDQQDSSPVDEATREEIREAILQAAGIASKHFEVLVSSETAPSIDSLGSQPLSLVLLALNPRLLDSSPEELSAEFRFVNAAALPKPAEIARLMQKTSASGYASFLQADGIDKLSCRVKDSVAEGEVAFHLGTLCKGRVQYKARKEAGKWIATEFHLPAWDARTVRQQDRWVASGAGVRPVVYLQRPSVPFALPRVNNRSRVPLFIGLDFSKKKMDLENYHISYRNELIEKSKLSDKLKAVFQEKQASDPILILHLDRTAPASLIIEVILSGYEAGFRKVSLAANVDVEGDRLPAGVFASAWGEFPLDLPAELPTPGEPVDLQIPDIRVRLKSNEEGMLVQALLGRTVMPGENAGFYETLNTEMLKIIGRPGNPLTKDIAVEIDADDRLRFEHIARTLAACSGRFDPNSQEMIRYIEQIKLRGLFPDSEIEEKFEPIEDPVPLELPVEEREVTKPPVEALDNLDVPQIELSIEPIDDLNGPLEIELPGEIEENVKGDPAGRLRMDRQTAALDRVTMELARLLHRTQVLVVWVFDETASTIDESTEINKRFGKVYQELEVLREQGQDLRGPKEPLRTVVASYGEKVHVQTSAPTADSNQLQNALKNRPRDESGRENTFRAIHELIQKYARVASLEKRKLVLIVVTDEAGDDGDQLELALRAAKRSSTCIYVLGREAIFGSPTSHSRWLDPEGIVYRLPVRRGPETAFVECLQWDGFVSVNGVLSGFGPYELTRLVRETGGIYFVLPDKQEKLPGKNPDYLTMRSYAPSWESRTHYQAEIAKSRFRSTIVNVIKQTDPSTNPEFQLKTRGYSVEEDEFRPQAGNNFQRAMKALAKLNQSVELLKAIEPLRAEEESERWRANYDLISAQCLCYRIRLMQYMLALDIHSRSQPKPAEPQGKLWNIVLVQQLLQPDEVQFERLQNGLKLQQDRTEFLKQMESDIDEAKRRFEQTIKNHPDTPWARRAKRELRSGFGITFREGFQPPVDGKTRLPKL